MNRLSKHDVNKLSMSKLLDLLPFVITNDGVSVALVCDVNNVHSDKADPDIYKLTELPLAKTKQAKHTW